MTLKDIKDATWRRKLVFESQRPMTAEEKRNMDRARLAADVEAFKRKGGKITQLPNWVPRQEPDLSEWRND